MDIKKPVAWIWENRQWVFSGIGVLVVGTVASVIRAAFGRTSKASEPPGRATTSFSGTVVLHGEVREVFYRVPFESPPYLRVSFEEGRRDILEIVEQRPDGFRVRIGGSGCYTPGIGIVIKWEAEGLSKYAGNATQQRSG